MIITIFKSYNLIQSLKMSGGFLFPKQPFVRPKFNEMKSDIYDGFIVNSSYSDEKYSFSILIHSFRFIQIDISLIYH